MSATFWDRARPGAGHPRSRAGEVLGGLATRSWAALWARDAAPTGPPAAEVSLARPTLVGTLGVLATVAGSSAPGSPFSLKLPGAWFFGTAANGGHAAAIAVLASWLGLFAVAWAWLDLVQILRASPGVSPRRLVPIAVLWVLPVLIAAPMLSRDVYSYAAQGDMVTAGLNPTRFGPGILGDPTYQHLVDPIWLWAPAPYGPLFLSLAGAAVQLSAHHVLGTIILLRLSALGGVVLMAVSLPTVARSYGFDPATAVALGVFSPLVLFGLVSAGHNDALMVGLVVAGLAANRRGYPFLGVLLASLAAAVKAPALGAVVFLGWQWLGPDVPWRERVRPVVTAGGVLVVVLAVAAAVTHLGWAWLSALATPGSVWSVLTPTDAIGSLAALVLAPLHSVLPASLVRSGVRAAGEAASVLIASGLLWWSGKLRLPVALGLAFLAVVVLGPAVQPWYLVWGLSCLAAVAVGPLRRLVIGVSLAGTFFWVPNCWVVLSWPGRVVWLAGTAAGLALALWWRPQRFRVAGAAANPGSEGVALPEQP